jgi:hypothetical protein
MKSLPLVLLAVAAMAVGSLLLVRQRMEVRRLQETMAMTKHQLEAVTEEASHMDKEIEAVVKALKDRLATTTDEVQRSAIEAELGRAREMHAEAMNRNHMQQAELKKQLARIGHELGM